MSKTDVKVELFYSDIWNDITSDVLVRDGIRITRGRPDESSRTPPSTLNLTLNNADGVYSPRNPMSPLYGLIGRNQPIRVRRGTITTEDFEDGSLDITVTTSAGATTGWARASDQAHTGTWSLKSNDISDSQVAAVDIAVPANANTLTFWYKVSSEPDFDVFEVSSDDWIIIPGVSGEVDWTQVIVDISHATTITLTYRKDSSTTTGSDAAWVDGIEFTECRFTGEVESWPQRWNVKGSDVWTPLTANGIMRRLNAPGTTKPARSALKRSVLGRSATEDLLCYWPMEDSRNATVVGSGLNGGVELTATDVNFDASLVPLGSEAALDLTNGGIVNGATGLSGTMTSWMIEFVVGWETLPTDNTDLYHILTIETPGSTILRWSFWLQINVSGDVLVALYRYSVAGGMVNVDAINPLTAREPVYVGLLLEQNGSDVDVEFTSGSTLSTATVTGVTLTAPDSLRFASVPAVVDPAPAGFSAPYTGDGPPSSLCHVAIWATGSTLLLNDAVTAYTGETAVERITRLCLEDDMSVTIYGDRDAAHVVGPQRAAPFLDLLQDAADVDSGILYEPRGYVGFVYRTGRSLYNQTPIVELDYSAGDEVAPPLEPVEDSDAIANDITVKRYLGSSARVVQETGPLNIQEPADDLDGVGRYAKDLTLLLATDDQCLPQAGWRKHLGTWDEARYPVVNVELTTLVSLADDVARLDVGDRFCIENPPAWLPPDNIEQLAQGFTEVLESHRWYIAINATPAGPYEIFVVETGTGNRSRLGAEATTTNEALDTTETGVDIISTAVRWIDSATYSAMFPFDVLIGGERMSVTALSGTGLTQTMTVTRSVNGIVKSHATGTKVQIFRPARVAL